MNKTSKLILSIILDFIGILSIAFPGIGEFTDLIWAPLSAIILFFIYKKEKVLPAVFIGFLEEFLPFSDFIPTFTLTWFYVNFLKKKKDIEASKTPIN